MKKRVLSLILALVMLLSVLPVQAFAEEEPNPDEAVVLTEEEPKAEEPKAEEPKAEEPKPEEPKPEEPKPEEPKPEEPKPEEPKPEEPKPEEPKPEEPKPEEPKPEEPKPEEPKPEEPKPEEPKPEEPAPEVPGEEKVDEEAPVGAPDVLPTEITVTAPGGVPKVLKGGKLMLDAVVKPDTTTNKSVTWSSDNPAVATVDPATGEVTGVAEGTATITATSVADSSISGTITVTVAAPVSVDSVSVTAAGGLTEVEEGKTLQLTAAVLPDDAADKTVTWSSSDETVATVDASGVVTGVKVGHVTITAISNADALKQGEIELDVTEAALYAVTIDPATPGEITAGETVDLKATLTPENKDAKIQWRLKKYGYNEYATLTADGKLLGDVDILEKHTIEVEAYTKIDGIEYKDSAQITIIPRVKKINLTVTDTEGTKAVKDNEYMFNLNDDKLVSSGLIITAEVLPEDANQEVAWTFTDTNELCTHSDASDHVLVKTKDSKTGAVTVTATAKDRSNTFNNVVVRFVRLATDFTFLIPEEYKDEATGGVKTFGGNAVQLDTTVSKQTGLTHREIEWEVSNTKVASIDANGLLSTKTVTQVTTFTVTARVKHNPKVEKTLTVTLCPIITSITVSLPTGKTNTMKYDKGIEFTMVKQVMPKASENNVRWLSSDPKVAKVDAKSGKVTIMGPGQVRITCEATDGSLKQGSQVLNLIKPAELVEIIDKPVNDVVISGDSINLRARVWTLQTSGDNILADNQGVYWKVYRKDSNNKLVTTSTASITTSGRLTANSVKTNTKIIVKAISKEDSKVFCEYEITVKPNQEKTLLLYMDGARLGSSKIVNVGDTYSVYAKYYDRDGAGSYNETSISDCTFYSSRPSVASIDKYGTLTAKAKGTATITVRWKDPATSKLYSGEFKVTVKRMVKSITMSTVPEILRSGSSLRLKAVTWSNQARGVKADDQKITWRVYEVDGGVEKKTTAASISSSGKLVAKTVKENVRIRVYAISAENGMSRYRELTICPKATYRLEAFYNNKGSGNLKTGTVVLPVNKDYVSDAYVGARLYVANTKSSSFGQYKNVDVTWKTSNSKVVAIKNGLPVFKGVGTATLTARYKVGGKTYTDKLTIRLVNAVTSIKIGLKTADKPLISGKSTYMRAVVSAGSTNKAVRWSVSGGNGWVSINPTSGLLTAKAGLKTPKTFTVTATAADGYGATNSTTLTVYPAATKVTIYKNGVPTDVVDPVETISLGKDIDLDVTLDPSGAYADGITWYSSNTSVASITANGGSGATVKGRQRGTVLIRATTVDGKTASFKLVIE